MTMKNQNWNLEKLFKPPKWETVNSDGDIRAVLYENEPYMSKPARVFAWLGIPKTGKKNPAMVLVHGGGGTAFKEWVELWNKRGYAAISMDLTGKGPSGRLPDAGPDETDKEKFFDLFSYGWKECWTYHSAAAVIRANSLLRSLPEIDCSKIGITGISWGGYLTGIVAGLDRRFACAVPVYGCGFLQHNSCFIPIFARMTEEQRRQWHALCDPSVYVGNAGMPVLFISGTNDFAYPPDSHKMTYSLVKNITFCIRKEMPHGHSEGWSPEEIYCFTGHHLCGFPGLPEIGAATVSGNIISAVVKSERKLVKAYLVVTESQTDWKDWVSWKWQEIPAHIGRGKVWADLPEKSKAYFLAVIDDKGMYVSSK